MVGLQGCGSFAGWRNHSGREGMAATRCIARALRSVETIADTHLSSNNLHLTGLGNVIAQNAEATRAAFEQVRPEVEALIRQGKPKRADEVLRNFGQSYNALLTSLGYAEYEVEWLLCEGSGNDWDQVEERCT
jgi:hypothetical protein